LVPGLSTRTLIWGLPAEEPIAAVWRELVKLRAPRFCLDQSLVLETAIDDGHLSVGRRGLYLDDVGACYLRPYDTRRMPSVVAAGEGSPGWLHALELDNTMLGWLEITPARVVNRPQAMLPNSSKPYQLLQLKTSGFAVPDTLLTTDPQAAAEFWELHSEVVYKAMSGVRSRVSRLTPAHRARLEEVVTCPTMFQEYVAGADFRCHVVGGEVLACRIMSEADDYRHSEGYGPPEIRAEVLPNDVAELCRNTAAAMGLVLAGIDLRRTPAGKWYCFEVNPSPAFTYYELATGQPLAATVARVLVEGVRSAA
jgi:ribosomal protein S6-L-glutamate ligase RimK-like protein